ncbi:hypothetical protein [Curvivirga sp.]|uniref:hypothetical protein n=1 Tax=Curvivirga sp. TaxID=2856848 RepID=UPI003B5C934A
MSSVLILTNYANNMRARLGQTQKLIFQTDENIAANMRQQLDSVAVIEHTIRDYADIDFFPDGELPISKVILSNFLSILHEYNSLISGHIGSGNGEKLHIVEVQRLPRWDLWQGDVRLRKLNMFWFLQTNSMMRIFVIGTLLMMI